MSPAILEMPATFEDRIPWLEKQLVGSGLHAFVEELRLVGEGHQPDSAAQTLDDVLGAQRDSVLQNGLGHISERQVQHLFESPELLLELQEFVLAEGSNYWIDLCNSGIASPTPPVHEELDSATHTGSSSAAVAVNKSTHVAPATPQLNHRLWTAALAVAACLLLAIGIWRTFYPPGPAGKTWGFSDLAALETMDSSVAYFNGLADAANEWFNVTPSNDEELIKRLEQFSRGCEVLLASEHRPLSQGQRDWLDEKCRKWKKDIDDLASRVQYSEIEFAEGLDAANFLIKNLTDRLKEQAELA